METKRREHTVQATVEHIVFTQIRNDAACTNTNEYMRARPYITKHNKSRVAPRTTKNPTMRKKYQFEYARLQ